MALFIDVEALMVKINNYFSGVDFIKYQDLDAFKLYEFKKANRKKSFIVESNFSAINIDTSKQPPTLPNHPSPGTTNG